MIENAIQLAQRTKSDQFHGDLIPLHSLKHWVTEAIHVLHQLDRIKKSIAYGRPYAVTPLGMVDSCEGLCIGWKGLSEAQARDVLHGILGKATEAGELLELLRDTIANPESFNATGVVEETFDSRWYDYACIFAALGVTPEAAEAAGFAKLRARFPDKFTVERADNRDLKAEAVAFTGNQDAAPLQAENMNSGDLIAAMGRDRAGS